MEQENLIKDTEFEQINQVYDECLNYLKNIKEKNITQYETRFNEDNNFNKSDDDPEYETIDNREENIKEERVYEDTGFKVENERIKEFKETKSDRLRRLSQQLPKIIITQSNSSLNVKKGDEERLVKGVKRTKDGQPKTEKKIAANNGIRPPLVRTRGGYSDFPKRLVSKGGIENVALISNVPFEKIRLLNDTFHTLINLRWRWIVLGTVVVHFTIWLVFAVFWYITALAHYDFAPDPPLKTCVTGGTDFLTIFLASVEAQTTIGFGDRAIDEECPESIFLFIMQLILGTGLSGVLTCVVYAKLTRPEKLSRDGVGFSKKAVIGMRDGQLCLMMRAWDLNYDHIICSEFNAHFVNTHRTKEGEIIRYYARGLPLQQRQFLLWPVTLVHVIDVASPLYRYTPDLVANNNYEITVSLKGASASMGTFTQSQTSYTPREVVWGHRFPPVIKYDSRKQKYVIDHKKLDAIEPVDTPLCSASELNSVYWSMLHTPSC
ncbi:ATP-sensitive inward rectifier potassium channel 11-like isoform X2 [Pectinophora gossypiella]|uniref:ATP-sensitive inward rectifier potassium channel 11-like isoform X2 n=1 Tax=Pectinophora gossypiella TaxID=13191 RepID=UPI00214EC860|nr:ATP-sensitive inward rectifier potassium channel 11-like isoform X2 [Pectinophora gossypiella]